MEMSIYIEEINIANKIAVKIPIFSPTMPLLPSVAYMRRSAKILILI